MRPLNLACNNHFSHRNATMSRVAGIVASLIPAIAYTLLLAADKTDAKGIAFFEKKIRPVLVKHCYQCHSSQSKKPKGDCCSTT